MLKIKKFLFWFLLIGGMTALGSVMLRPPPFSGPIHKRAPDIFLPDALIRSHSLSKLPPDLLRIPLARHVLTEDFITYYEQNENRMALSGTLRRIAFEHKLDFPEKLLASVFDEPAEVALWRDDAGRLKDFVIVLSRNHLARIIQTLLPAAVKATDMQLSSAGKLDGTDVEILALKYGIGHQLLLLSKGDRIVALSNPGMLLMGNKENNASWPQSKKAVEIIRELLEGRKPVSPFAEYFSLNEPLAEKNHELTLGARVFALNYESFVPGLEALRLTFGDQGDRNGWQSTALIDGSAWRDNENMSLWAALPHGPGFCAALPVDWAQMTSVLEEFNTDKQQHPKKLTANFTGPAAVCWYKDSRLYTPLFAAHLAKTADEKQVQEFFNLAAQLTKAGEGETSMDASSNSARWQGEIASRFGSISDNGERRLKPALVIRRDIVFFSPDATLVENALAVAAKRYPALADSFHSKKDTPLAFVDPGALASLLRKEIFTALPRDEEALFRNAAEAYLVPRLDALAGYPAQRIVLSKKVRGNDSAWYPLEWKGSTDH
jgi:uncharacterized protein YfaA (DUF2138 family)